MLTSHPLMNKKILQLSRICKKTKTHRSPEWSRLVRQKLDEWEGEFLNFFFRKAKTRLIHF